ncbi:MAG: hypothetical protein HN334_05680 [Candidatus Cloacimonetes bacterium]|jgi:uncharacterized protein|nr:hypothetical protein [Candidatus Cloacimonadota bacterium]MBT7470149.1 hypothetical protein [Candidatus Cloacimonadota bacterium]
MKIILLIILIFTISCASIQTQKSHFVVIENNVLMQNYSDAILQLETSKDKFYNKKDRVVYYLDLGMLLHFDKQYERSNRMLSEAEKGIAELYTKSVTRAASSLLLNDNVLEYAGEDYEDIYLNAFKALNYLALNKFDDSFVEIRRINEKLSFLEQKYTKLANRYNTSKNKKKRFSAGKNKFHNSALSRYLSLLLYRLEGKIDDAHIDKKKIDEAWRLQSHIYDFPKPNLEGHFSKSAKVKVNFISFIGRAPDKKAQTLHIHTEKNLLIISTSKENKHYRQNLQTLDTINWFGMPAGYHFKFQLPVLKPRFSKVGKIKIIVDDKYKTELQLLENIEKVTTETYETRKPLIYLKTITRSVIKGLASQKGKEKLTQKIHNPLLGFAARLATDVAVNLTENADLRISRFFPAKALIGEIELKSGFHYVKIEYYNKNGSRLFTDDLGEVEISSQKANIFESFYLN